MTQEIERSAKVFSSIQRNVEQDTGVMTSLNEEDVKNYLEKVKKRFTIFGKRKSMGDIQ
jgi:hypothetical protein